MKPNCINEHLSAHLSFPCPQRDRCLNVLSIRPCLEQLHLKPWWRLPQAFNGCADHLVWSIVQSACLSNTAELVVVLQAQGCEASTFAHTIDLIRISQVWCRAGTPPWFNWALHVLDHHPQLAEVLQGFSRDWGGSCSACSLEKVTWRIYAGTVRKIVFDVHTHPGHIPPKPKKADEVPGEHDRPTAAVPCCAGTILHLWMPPSWPPAAACNEDLAFVQAQRIPGFWQNQLVLTVWSAHFHMVRWQSKYKLNNKPEQCLNSMWQHHRLSAGCRKLQDMLPVVKHWAAHGNGVEEWFWSGATSLYREKSELIHNMHWCCIGMVWDCLGPGLQRPAVLQPLALGPSGKGFLYTWPTGSLMVVLPCPSMS